MLEEYGIDKAIESARGRWCDTNDLQRAGSALPPQLLALHPIIKRLRARFETNLKNARGRFDKTKPATIEALHRARERLQLVSGEHAPLDEEVHREHQALAPVLTSIAQAIAAIEEYEAQLAQRGRSPWYRRRVGGNGYWRKATGPVLRGHTRGTWVAGHEDTGRATRADEIWFARAGADPLVALTIAESVMKSVQPPPVKRNRQFEDEQINRVLELMKHTEVNLPTSEVSELLGALGYTPMKVSEAALNRRLSDLRARGHAQPIARSARGRVLGRPRTRGKR